MTLTGAQNAALKWINDRSGDAVFDRHGVALAQGDTAPIERKTWNALRDQGMIEFYNPSGKGYGRLRITDAGCAAISVKRSARPDPNNKHFGSGGTRVDRLPGADEQ